MCSSDLAPIELSGFELDEIDQLVVGNADSSLEEGRLEPNPDVCAIARLGDVFILGEHRLSCGDATDPEVIAKLMNSEAARMVFTDEPFNVRIAGNVTGGAHREFVMASGEMSGQEFLQFNQKWMRAVLPSLVDGGILTTFIDWRGLPTVHESASSLGLTALNLIVWAKTNAGMGSLYRSQYELLPMFKKGVSPNVNNILLGKRGRYRSNLWIYPGASSLGSDSRCGLRNHPTVKPVEMIKDALMDLSNRGELIVDPFCGSGSTLIACEKVGRIFRGVELDPLYVDVIVRRYKDIFGVDAILEETGETFDTLAKRRNELETSRPGDI